MQAMGIPVWMPKAQVAEEPPPSPSFSKGGSAAATTALLNSLQETPVKVPPFEQGGAGGISLVQPAASPQLPDCAQMGWPELRETVLACTRCAISKTRTRAVFGAGNQQADWMIIGEAPGANEDRQGEPFVGKAGQLLNNMLTAIGLSRDSVYIANVLKCRPPNNRDPKPEEVANCRAYLERQIELVNPALILVVGRIAAQNLLQTREPLARLRNREHLAPLTRTPVVVTYHPAYLLRQPADKRKAWQDLQFARKIASRNVH